ncbi:sigma 54-interacting transcriptional regulator [bacterium]|nr:sigma 54-interacting transcriptional regulator [bacterium]
MNAGNNVGARFELFAEEDNLLGRDWSCRIVLNDPQCSRVHAEAYYDEDGWWIKDCGSSNGTYVNGQTINSARLMEGTEVKIGSCKLSFVTMDAEAHEPGEQDNKDAPSATIIFDQSLDPKETGQYTLNFLRGHNLGQDFFFLFQLSVRLLGVDDPEEVTQICMRRLFDRTGASAAGFLWLNDSGKLVPKVFVPEGAWETLQLRDDLTKRVVAQMHAIRVEHESNAKDDAQLVDAICVPLISDGQVLGAIHLYRQQATFHDSHFELACAMANIMMLSLKRANRKASLEAKHSSLVQKSAAYDEMLGDSSEMQELKSKIGRVAKASGCVLIRGESGAGKELVARAVHRNSPRADRPMLSVNCAAIPRDLIESQLFGHKQGAFTSADRDHNGWFQQADLGTLFLDEIGELPLEGQAKLLRILEGHPFLPVGGTEEIVVDVRVICATNRDLKEFVGEKKFREDLYYRLGVYELYVPPLRDRGPDIENLINHFLEHYRNQHGKFDLKISNSAMERLISYHWPGNVRQLRNLIDSAVVMTESNEISLDDLGIRDTSEESLETLQIDHWERKLILEALKRTANSVPKAAKLLGISRATLYRKIEEYGIQRN